MKVVKFHDFVKISDALRNRIVHGAINYFKHANWIDVEKNRYSQLSCRPGTST